MVSPDRQLCNRKTAHPTLVDGCRRFPLLKDNREGINAPSDLGTKVIVATFVPPDRPLTGFIGGLSSRCFRSTDLTANLEFTVPAPFATSPRCVKGLFCESVWRGSGGEPFLRPPYCHLAGHAATHPDNVCVAFLLHSTAGRRLQPRVTPPCASGQTPARRTGSGNFSSNMHIRRSLVPNLAQSLIVFNAFRYRRVWASAMLACSTGAAPPAPSPLSAFWLMQEGHRLDAVRWQVLSKATSAGKINMGKKNRAGPVSAAAPKKDADS